MIKLLYSFYIFFPPKKEKVYMKYATGGFSAENCKHGRDNFPNHVRMPQQWDNYIELTIRATLKHPTHLKQLHKHVGCLVAQCSAEEEIVALVAYRLNGGGWAVVSSGQVLTSSARSKNKRRFNLLPSLEFSGGL